MAGATAKKREGGGRVRLRLLGPSSLIAIESHRTGAN